MAGTRVRNGLVGAGAVHDTVVHGALGYLGGRHAWQHPVRRREHFDGALLNVLGEPLQVELQERASGVSQQVPRRARLAGYHIVL